MQKTPAESTTVFVCAHGSLDRRSQQGFDELMQRFRRYSTFRIVSGTLEFSERLIDEQIGAAVRPGERFVLLPLFLAPGMHVEEDIAAALQRARRAHPQVTFLRTRALGEHEAMEALLAERLRQGLGSSLDEQTAAVLLAHGSRREEANRLVQDLADGVWEELGGPVVTAAFCKVRPDLRATLRELAQTPVRRVFVQPYFLFEGSITDRIGLELARLTTEFDKLQLQVGAVIGPDSRLLPLMQQLVESALESAFAVA